MRTLVVVAAVAMLATVAGCRATKHDGVTPSPSTSMDGTSASSGCDLDVDHLEGMFVGFKSSPHRGDYTDKDFRILFFEEDGQQKAISTGGRVFPQLPLTEKYTYVRAAGASSAREGQGWESRSPWGRIAPDKPEPPIEEARYDTDFIAPFAFTPEELEEHQQRNENLGWMVEGTLYVRVDSERCRLKVADMYTTWINGERIEDYRLDGRGVYVRSEEDRYGMVQCPPAYRREHPEANRQGELVAWDVSEPAPGADEPFERGRKGTIVEAGEPIYWIYEDPALTRDTAPEGCHYYLDVYLDDLPVDGLAGIPVEVGNERTLWRFEMEHSAEQENLFIEIHRHEVCDGEDRILDSVCNIVSSSSVEAGDGAE